ncbi:MAG: OpgC family protein [Beijerinckiaceae bacterium]
MSVTTVSNDLRLKEAAVRPVAVVSSLQRDLRLDFFRGLALLIIFIDHVAGNRFAALTLQSIGFADAAEVFVFIAGMAAVYAYRKVYIRDGLKAVSRAVLSRVRTLYLAHLMMLTGFAVLAGLSLTGATTYDLVHKLGLKPMLETPLEAALLAPVLAYLPNYLDILPLYVLLLATLPIILAANRIHVLLPLALASLSYATAQVTGVNMPNFGNVFGWFLNPLAWVLLFTAGATVANLRISGFWLRVPRAVVALITVLSAAFVVLAFLHAAPWRIVMAFEHYSVLALDFTPDKALLTWHRLLDILAKAWLVAVIVPVAAVCFTQGIGGAISRLGRHSLPIFIAGTFLSIFGSVIVHEADHHILADVLVTAGGIGLLMALGWVLENARLQVPTFKAHTGNHSLSVNQQQK